MKIACLQFAPHVGDVGNNLTRADAVLSKADPKELENLDLLVLPEMAFSGYNFKSLQHITPFLEHSGSGISSLWARTTALKYDCAVAVGYPERADRGGVGFAGPQYFNSAIVVNGDGETVTNYRKSFLYYTDETWASEGSGFFHGEVGNLGCVAMGICMDINPYKFEAPWNAFEFAFHALRVRANLVVLSMAWLTLEEKSLFSRLLQEPHMETLTYWVQRLEPIIRAEYDEEIIVVFANRSGSEDDVVYAGTSTVLGIRDGEVSVYGLLGRGAKELLVVDTDMPPIAKLVNRPEPISGSEDLLQGDDVESESAATAAASIPEAVTTTSPKTQKPRSPRATLPPTPEDLTHPEIEEESPKPPATVGDGVIIPRHPVPRTGRETRPRTGVSVSGDEHLTSSPTGVTSISSRPRDSTTPQPSRPSPTAGVPSPFTTGRSSSPPPQGGVPQTSRVRHHNPPAGQSSTQGGYFPRTAGWPEPSDIVADGDIPTKIDFTRTPSRNPPPRPSNRGAALGDPLVEDATPPPDRPAPSAPVGTAPLPVRRPRRLSRAGSSRLENSTGEEDGTLERRITSRRRPASPTTPPPLNIAVGDDLPSDPRDIGLRDEDEQPEGVESGPPRRHDGNPSISYQGSNDRGRPVGQPAVTGKGGGSSRVGSKEGRYRMPRSDSYDKSGLGGVTQPGLPPLDTRPPLQI